MANLIPNFYRGDTVPVRIEYAGPVDITGWIFTITFKSALTDTTPALQLQQTAIGADAILGIVRFEITSEQTATLGVGTFFLDIERRIPGNPDNVATILYQKIKALPDVTV